jgi:DNA-binding MarR family transcriptional regulator
MRDEKGTSSPAERGDVRRWLCERKYFGLRPEPLQRYLYQLNVSRSAERVFWLHWDLGYRHGDFCSEVPVSEVARRVCLNASSVTRAYQCLRRHGLIRRQDQGRDPRTPFRALTAVTEVLLPRAVLGELLAAPDRGAPRTAKAVEVRSRAEPHVTPGAGIEPAKASTSTAEPAAAADLAANTSSTACVTEALPTPSSASMSTLSARPDRATLLRLFAKLTENERREFWRAQRAAAAGTPCRWQPAPGSALSADEAAQLSALAEQVNQAPVPRPSAELRSGTRTPSSSPARLLNALSLAYLRRALARLVSAGELEERMREVVWSAECGSLAKFEPRHALNIALKKVRLQEWTRPHRMPARWRCALA